MNEDQTMPEIIEPEHSNLFIKLGVTRGAFVGLVVLFVLVFVGFWRIHANSEDIRDTADRADRAAIRAQSVATLAGQLAFTNSILVKQGQQARRVECAQKKSLRDSVRRSVQFLADVETGKRSLPPGFSKVDVLAGLKRNQDLLKAFDDLNC